MSQSRPTLSHLKRVCPQDLARCEGYVWHLGTKIGKGSFGEVYLGWNNVSNNYIAVIVVVSYHHHHHLLILGWYNRSCC